MATENRRPASRFPSIVRRASRSTGWWTIEEFSYHRTLDRGNSTPGNLGTDFNRLGIRFGPEVLAVDTRNAGRRQAIEELAVWRNAIAHQDFDPARLGGRTALQLQQVLGWRIACQSLVRSFDQVMRNHLKSLFGAPPW